MKKLVSILLVLILLLVPMAACSDGSDDPTEAPADDATEVPADDPTEAPAPEGDDDDDDDTRAGDVANDPKVTITYAEVNPLDSLMGQTAQTFKEAAEELSGGSITVNLQAGGVMGDEGAVLDTMTGGVGTVDVARISTMSLKDYDGISVTNLLSVPYMFSSRDHFWATVDSSIGDEIKVECHDAGLNIRGLFFVEEGFRHFFFEDEIDGIEDLQGMKIRVSVDSTSVGMVEGLGASATPVDFTELYSALSTGVVDAAEQPIVNYQSNAFYEVAPYMILDGHTMGSGMIIISDDCWDSLTEAQREVLVEAGRRASEFNRNNSAQIEQTCIGELEADGVTFIPVDDVQPWRDACQAIISEVTAGLESYVDQILDLE